MEKKTMDPVKAYLRRRQHIAEQIRSFKRCSVKRSFELADFYMAEDEHRRGVVAQRSPAHWSAPKSGPEWYAEAFNEAYIDYLSDGMHPDDIDLELVEDRIRSMHDTKRHRQRLRLAVLASLWRAAQAPEETDERAHIVDRVILYEEAVSKGVRLDEVNEALQLMAQDRKTRKEQNRLAYIVRRMKGGKNEKVGC
jgi:hypothetical protein